MSLAPCGRFDRRYEGRLPVPSICYKCDRSTSITRRNLQELTPALDDETTFWQLPGQPGFLGVTALPDVDAGCVLAGESGEFGGGTAEVDLVGGEAAEIPARRAVADCGEPRSNLFAVLFPDDDDGLP